MDVQVAQILIAPGAIFGEFQSVPCVCAEEPFITERPQLRSALPSPHFGPAQPNLEMNPRPRRDRCSFGHSPLSSFPKNFLECSHRPQFRSRVCSLRVCYHAT
jgi:hypothetical protein